MASWYSMRFAIVDDLDTERTLLKERLARQLRQRGTEAELLEFDSGEAFLAAEKERRFFVCGRGAIINMENAADFQDAAFCMTDGSRVYVSQELLKAARQAFMEFLLQRGRVG